MAHLPGNHTRVSKRAAKLLRPLAIQFRPIFILKLNREHKPQTSDFFDERR